MNLFYSAEALTDLARLRAFIAKHDPQAASRVARDLVKRIKNLQKFPEMGVSVPEAPDPNAVRDFAIGQYIVRYAIHAETLFILRIWHGRENREDGT